MIANSTVDIKMMELTVVIAATIAFVTEQYQHRKLQALPNQHSRVGEITYLN
jgi:cell division protein FtsL